MSIRYRLLPTVRCIVPALFLLLGSGGVLTAQESKDFAVMLRADVTKAPRPSITLHWIADPYASGYSVWRKARHDAQFPQAAIAQLDSTATSYTDNNVVVGLGYEYQVIKQCAHKLTDTTILSYNGIGYIFSGIERAPEELPGRVLLLVDSTMATPLTSELTRLENDLIGEGWKVTRRDVPRTEQFNGAAVKSVKAIITSINKAAPQELTTVLIIGRVAVPYSGDINPDGHPDHLGAWPADAYYGDMTGVWTDAAVSDSGAGRVENRNVIGDGKFDQSTIPAALKLAVGRVDFYNMPLFTDPETQLLRKYLNKDHAFRSGAVKAIPGGIIDDNFGAVSYPEAFASSGWRTMTLFGGDTAAHAADWFTTLAGPSTYLWAYGCGGGTFTSAGGIGSTPDFVAKPVNAVFTMLFGSYFGDWDSQNNFLRASLAGGPGTLTCAWDARPQWYFHHMALGETVGYSTVASQNNSTLYIPNVYYNAQYPNGLLYTFGNRFVHVALMGDPTLRAQMKPVPQPLSLTVTGDTSALPTSVLQWGAPVGHVDGYFVYRAVNDSGVYRLLNRIPLTAMSYIDTSLRGFTGPTLVAHYIVRAAVLQQTASGTYYAGGAGAEESVQLAGVTEQRARALSFNAVPNPAQRRTALSFSLDAPADVSVDVYDLAGAHVQRLAAARMQPGVHGIEWDLRDAAGRMVPAGVYVATMSAAGGSSSVKIIVTR